ncbi:diguanylate cyclase (GGDEF) domain-containing protein [Mycolicibacterium chubuense NBB4]|uniref:Diguanylate cyclase (GGDEF) domain-containing protein n=1 Tax=Mycolicibacterium chubuense (strain NBB4) TaxID=710421 RepID=I4BF82_MYCCN|nr:diguanylate cyclase [Mycolicibacterium chubuense]AFM15939.1 diguanylate cyclase (GGDEF) domain-containing protein [Mycolicibacterium chubuense NBB4]
MFESLRSSSASSIGPAIWRSDQYYWFTAVLAARGMQTATCRLVALCIAALGLIPVAMMSSVLGPQGLHTRVIAIVIAVGSLGMAALWLRDHWPSRAQSLLCVCVGSIAVAMSALIVSSPIVGFLGATSYVLLTVFVVCFHTPRLLAVTWTVGAVVLGVLLVRLSSTDLALAISATGVVVLLNVFVAFSCRAVIRLIQPDAHHGDIEQLTGLLHRDAFYRAVATLLASRSRSDDKYLVVVAVNIDSFSLLLGLTGARGGNRARVTVGQALRETVRHNAIVAHVSDDDFLIADTFTTADASPLVERIRGAINTTPQRLTASIGVVCTPLPPLAAEPPDDVLDKLIGIATTAIEQARMAGGNQVRYVLRPNLGDGDPGHGDADDWPDADKTA